MKDNDKRVFDIAKTCGFGIADTDYGTQSQFLSFAKALQGDVGEPAAWLVDGNVEQLLFWTKEDAENAAEINCGAVKPLFTSPPNTQSDGTKLSWTEDGNPSQSFHPESALVEMVRAPRSIDEAIAMEKIGYAYLKEHAPERLPEPQSMLDKAIEALRFYADKRNWHKDYEVSDLVSRYITMYYDQEEINDSVSICGKKAREALKELEK